MRRLLAAALLLPTLALAEDFKYAGTLNAASGASTNNADAASTKADGTTAAIGSLGGTTAKPLKLYIQCDVAVRLRTGTANTVAAANTGANKGVKLDAEQLFPFDLKRGWLAIIPASGSGSAACDLFIRF